MLLCEYFCSYGIVERTDIRLGRQFKRTNWPVSRRRKRSSKDIAVLQRFDRRLGPSRYMYQPINIGCLVHGYQQVNIITIIISS